MTQIEDRVRSIEANETSEVLQASHSWQISRWVSLATTSTALAASLGLVLLLTHLSLRLVRSKEREAEELAQRHAELERLVEQRTEELSELSTHLQSLAEKEKSALSRELHDELGGLTGRRAHGCLLDRGAAEHGGPGVQAHFRRVHEALQTGVDVKRRVVENLRPTLLDNLGLFPALRWQVADTCGRAGLKLHRALSAARNCPADSRGIDCRFSDRAGSAHQHLKHARAQTIEISIETQAPWLLVRVRDDGVGLPLERLRAPRSHGLAAMRHRAAGLGGHWQVHRPAGGGTQIEVRLPLERVLAEAAAGVSDDGQIA